MLVRDLVRVSTMSGTTHGECSMQHEIARAVAATAAAAATVCAATACAATLTAGTAY